VVYLLELGLLAPQDRLVEHAVVGALALGELLAAFDLLEQREVLLADLLAEIMVRRVDGGFFVQQVDAGRDLGRAPFARIERQAGEHEGQYEDGCAPPQHPTGSCFHLSARVRLRKPVVAAGRGME